MTFNPRRLFKWAFLSAVVGVLAGTSSAIFLHLLNWATEQRVAHPELILFLPLGGAGVGYLYHRYGRGAERGHVLILDEIHDPKTTLPLRMAPLVLLGTLVTHLFGGSAGREGTAVQMGASLADQLSKFFHIDAEERKTLLVAGAGAGFGAAIGAPFAGLFFGMEVIYVRGLKPFAILECAIASFVGYHVTFLLRAPHSHYPAFELAHFDARLLISTLVMGAVSGVVALLFVKLTHGVEAGYRKFRAVPWIRPLIGGAVLVGLYRLLGTDRYAGLGIPVIQESLVRSVSFLDPFYKTVLSAITVGSGFKGGEFVPLVFIGATLGSALSVVIPGTAAFLGSLGFAAVFAGAANTPFACSLMAVEIFGLSIAPYAIIACFVSYFCSGRHGIYGIGQR